MGAATRYGIQRALDCPALRDVPADSPARNGIITDTVWHAVMGEAPAPTLRIAPTRWYSLLRRRTSAIAPEWNLCQDGERRRQGTGKAAGNDLVCYNESDPCSFVTWGPRGATAGAGREIQLILWMVSKQDPALLQKAFGTEYPNLQRFFQLKGGGKSKCDGDIPLKRFVCAVWMDRTRRKIWEQALAALGHSALVRKAYNDLYAAANSTASSCRTTTRSGANSASTERDRLRFLSRPGDTPGRPTRGGQRRRAAGQVPA